MSGLSTRDFGTREDAVITDLEADGDDVDKSITAMGLYKGMVQRLGEITDALDQVITALAGRLNVGAAAPADTWQYAAVNGGITNQTAVMIAAAPAAGKRNYLTALQIINTDATVATEVTILDGATVIWRGLAPATVAAVSQPSMVPIVFQPPLRQPSVATALKVAAVSDSAQLYVNAQGYVAD